MVSCWLGSGPVWPVPFTYPLIVVQNGVYELQLLQVRIDFEDYPVLPSISSIIVSCGRSIPPVQSRIQLLRVNGRYE